MTPMAYAPHVPSGASFTQYDIPQVVRWMTKPDGAYGATPAPETPHATGSCSARSTRRWRI